MFHPIQKESNDHRPRIVTAGFQPAEGVLLEMIYREEEHKTLFAFWNGESVRYQDTFSFSKNRQVVPYSPDNNLIRNHVLLFPSRVEEFGTEEKLAAEIQAFIHRYVDISPLFEKIASYYVLFTWVYDAFSELPYLRVRGDYGSGKTRFLRLVGSLCFRAIFSGTSTVSPLFRILDMIKGTLVIDEGDFRFSDERAEVVKILNNGNAKGFPVLRSELAANHREFNPTAYDIFGPKIVATRGFFDDRGLESRFITEQMGQYRLREDIPINLPSSWEEEALQLRNKLLLFRFRNLHRCRTAEELVNREIEPRLNQIFVPLLSIVDDAGIRDDLWQLALRYHRETVAERGMDMEAQILEIIRDLALSSFDGRLAIKDIANWFADRHGSDYQKTITPKWIGWIIRRRLQLKTQKSHGVYVISSSELPKLERLYEKYGITSTESPNQGGSGTEKPPAAVAQRDLETSGTSGAEQGS